MHFSVFMNTEKHGQLQMERKRSSRKMERVRLSVPLRISSNLRRWGEKQEEVAGSRRGLRVLESDEPDGLHEPHGSGGSPWSSR